jgi:hypothetical protein
VAEHLLDFQERLCSVEFGVVTCFSPVGLLLKVLFLYESCGFRTCWTYRQFTILKLSNVSFRLMYVL